MVYINIDQVLNEAEWEVFIRKIRADFPEAPLGIFSGYNNPVLAEKYLKTIGCTSGYITLRNGLENARQAILMALQANEARGRRRYIRITPPPGSATFNIRRQGNFVAGKIFDISMVGMCIAFDNVGQDFPEGGQIKDIQLMLKGLRVKVDAVVVKKRVEPGKLTTYILLFEKSLLPTDREKIHTYIMRSLQLDLENWIRD